MSATSTGIITMRPWLKENLRRDIPVLLPGYPTREQRRRMEALGFTNFITTVDTEELEIAPGPQDRDPCGDLHH
jgi:hypothetical protein